MVRSQTNFSSNEITYKDAKDLKILELRVLYSLVLFQTFSIVSDSKVNICVHGVVMFS